MDSNTQRETVHFTSGDGKTSIQGYIWWPQTEAKAIVQLVHGMAEYILRYEPFANYLCERGFVVCGHDHLGHGDSVTNRSEWGHIPAADGKDILVGDVGRMRALVTERVQSKLSRTDLPYFIFGHSMGSFVVRAYIAECGEGLAGAIICGTGHIATATSSAGNALARGIGRVRGEHYVSKILGNLSVGAYSKAIENPRTPLDWLSYNEKNVDDYIADERCGFAFTAGGNATLTALTKAVCNIDCCRRVPHELPLLYIAGDGDPVGNMGEGVRTAAQMARDGGSNDVTCTIYEHMRHEILNEDKCVMEDVAKWMEERI